MTTFRLQQSKHWNIGAPGELQCSQAIVTLVFVFRQLSNRDTCASVYSSSHYLGSFELEFVRGGWQHISAAQPLPHSTTVTHPFCAERVAACVSSSAIASAGQVATQQLSHCHTHELSHTLFCAGRVAACVCSSATCHTQQLSRTLFCAGRVATCSSSCGALTGSTVPMECCFGHPWQTHWHACMPTLRFR